MASLLLCFLFTWVKFCCSNIYNANTCCWRQVCSASSSQWSSFAVSCVWLYDSVNTQLWNGEQLPKDACLICACWSVLQLFSMCLHGTLKRSVVVQGCVWNHSCIIICILPVHQLCNYLIWPARSDHENLTPFNERHHSWEAMWCCNWMKLINPMPANTTNSVRLSGRGLCNIRCTEHCWEVDLSVTSSKRFKVMVEVICSLLHSIPLLCEMMKVVPVNVLHDNLIIW